MTIPVLVARGVAAAILDAGEVLDGAVSVYPQPRSNVVHRVERHGVPLAYVKQRGASSMLDGDDVVMNERMALTALAGLNCVPRLLPLDDAAAVWVRAVPGQTLAEVPFGGDEFDVACRALARSLAELHTWSVDVSVVDLPRAPEPWALRSDHLPPSMAGSPAGSACAAVLELADEPGVRAALNHAASRWTATSWIHGDVSANNVIIHRGRAWLVDLEGAGMGHPAWDLATAVSTLRGLGGSGAEFLTEYWQRGGPARLDDSLLTLRAVQSAWQLAAHGTQRGDHADHGNEQFEAARRHAASFLATHGGR